ncbi:hypothetical protein AVEN_69672-1 [Araneus ventricosus]|uniref:Tc1-like transposase DDE domain-containing protein n=1 Tax=Araneus ventricosus TaxID=182803 RepID=A0A4Y2JMN7_ARAVE|nr:hypothetical protein AVEN_69672-1 [Araneus ventricosus]
MVRNFGEGMAAQVSSTLSDDGSELLGQRPCHKARIVLEWFQEHTDEFHLMPFSPNSPDLNPMEHIWDVMERQLRAQTPPCPNIPTLRDGYLDIWYNLSPVMY